MDITNGLHELLTALIEIILFITRTLSWEDNTRLDRTRTVKLVECGHRISRSPSITQPCNVKGPKSIHIQINVQIRMCLNLCYKLQLVLICPKVKANKRCTYSEYKRLSTNKQRKSTCRCKQLVPEGTGTCRCKHKQTALKEAQTITISLLLRHCKCIYM